MLSFVSRRLRLKRYVGFSYFLSKLKSLLNLGLISGFWLQTWDGFFCLF